MKASVSCIITHTYTHTISYSEHQYALLRNALNVVNRIPPSLADLEENTSQSSSWERDELAFKNMWNFNLPDAAYGSLLFNIHQGIVASEMRSYGLNFSYRKQQQQQQQATSSPAPSSISTAEKPNQYRNSTYDQQQQQQQQDTADTNNYNTNRNSKRQSMVSIMSLRLSWKLNLSSLSFVATQSLYCIRWWTI